MCLIDELLLRLDAISCGGVVKLAELQSLSGRLAFVWELHRSAITGASPPHRISNPEDTRT